MMVLLYKCGAGILIMVLLVLRKSREGSNSLSEHVGSYGAR
jgi:hypothetical protein